MNSSAAVLVRGTGPPLFMGRTCRTQENDYLCFMKFFEDYIPGGHSLNMALFWDYDHTKIDFQKHRSLVVGRIITFGRLNDWYAGFDLYGGPEGFARIAKEEVVGLTPKDLNFICRAFDIKKEETRCYIRKQLREKHLHS